MALRIFKNHSCIKLLVSSMMTVLGIGSIVGCKNLELSSQWRDREIVVDGINNEWQNATTFVEDENILIGTMNDENYLYLCLISNNQIIGRQMTAMGFTIWFDPNGGKKKVFGIQYPLGLQEMDPSMRGDWGPPDQNNENRRARIAESLTELKILGEKKDDWDRMLVTDATGIEVKVSTAEKPFIYELKVPLKRDEQHPYAIGTEDGKTIGVGLEVQEFDREKMMEGRQGGMHGGMGPPGGMRGGFRRRPGGGTWGGMHERPKPLKMRAKIHLAQMNESNE